MNKAKVTLSAAILMAFAFTSGFSQADTAYVPVLANVAATISMQPPTDADGASGDTRNVAANVPDTLKLILSGGSTPVLQTRMQMDAASDYSLFSLSGKRIEPQSNIAEGVYLLIAKGASGKRYATKVFHRGGSFNASAALGQSGLPLMKDGDSEAWVVTARAAGYVDTLYAFIPVKGMNALQIITLRPLAASSSSSLGGGTSSSSSGLGTSSSSLGASSSSLESSSSSSSALASIAAVSVHVTTPAINETPDNAARTDDAGYTIGAVSWQPAHNPFQGGTIYMATVTLAAESGHVFTGLTSAKINGYDASVSNNTGNAVTLSHTFAATLAKVVTGIAIKTQPSKLAYTHGDILNLAGLAVTVSYNDGTAQDIASDDFDAYNINTDPSLGEAVSHSSHNGKGIKVGLGAHNAATSNLSVSKAAGAGVSGQPALSGRSATYSVTVSAVTIPSNPGGQTVEYAISKSASVPASGWQAGTTFPGLDADAVYYVFARSAENSNYNAGTAQMSNGVSTLLTGIAVKTQPSKLAYTHGNALSLAGLTVTLSYDDGTAQDVAFANFNAYDITTEPGNGEALSRTLHNGESVRVEAGGHSAATNNLAVGKAAGAATSGGLTVSSLTSSSMTITEATIPSNPGGQAVEYAISTSTTAPSSGWQLETTFSGLNSTSLYYFWARSAENESHSTGAARRSSDGVATTYTGVCGQARYNPARHLCDSRDYKLYKHVTIGTQTWMAENLNYNTSGSACYDNNDANCVTYGRLYNWNTAMNNSASSSANPSGRRGVCPAGWHLPSDAEWDDLITAVGGSSTAGTKLKATSGWISGNGTDNYGFAALPGGEGTSGGSFFYAGNYGNWWISSEINAGNAYYRFMGYNYEGVYRDFNLKSRLLSVRCLQDSAL